MTALRSSVLFGAMIVVLSGAALAVRVVDLDRRPMHVDEAVHAIKFRDLFESGQYHYDREEFHGPTLNYLTLPVVWLSGAKRFADTSEVHYRVVPAVFGALLVALLWAARDGLGRGAALWAGVFTAISPVMVFYSRYYIQEMLLVFFTFGAIVTGWRCARSGSVLWAAACGAFVGLMHATKETCVIALAAMAVSLIVVRLTGRRRVDRPVTGMKLRHIACAAAAACLVSGVLFSSFLTNASGPIDSIRALGAYFERTGGQGSAAVHRHPWHYYLHLVLFYRLGPGPWWSEAAILLLGLVGLAAALLRRGLVRFIAVYTVLMTAAYAAIPYKTPWCLLGFWHGWILLAGLGAAALVRWMPRTFLKGLVVLALLAAGAHLARQAYLANSRFCADPRNPYVYAHTSPDLVRMANRIRRLASVHPAGWGMRINVVARGHDYWPLPWYLRQFDRDAVGYWAEVPEDPKAPLDAPLIVAGVSGDTLDHVDGRLHQAYQTEHYALRPGVLVRLYIHRPLWGAFLDRTAQGGDP